MVVLSLDNHSVEPKDHPFARHCATKNEKLIGPIGDIPLTEVNEMLFGSGTSLDEASELSFGVKKQSERN